MMISLNELPENPGIAQFLKAKTTAQRVAAYQQIPEWEMQNLWRLVSHHGSLAHVEFIYQKKLANSTFYQSLQNLWYGTDVHGWDEILQYVLESKDREKLEFILTKGACKMHLTEAQKEKLHQSILEMLKADPKCPFFWEDIFSLEPIIKNFLTLGRFHDYLSKSIKSNSIEQFKATYRLLPAIIKKSNQTNNIIFISILKVSDDVAFCEEALKSMSEQDNILLNGKINPLLAGCCFIKSSEHQTKINGFLEKYHEQLINGDKPFYTPKSMIFELLSDPILRQCFSMPNFPTENLPKYTSLERAYPLAVLRTIFEQESMNNIGKLWEILKMFWTEPFNKNEFILLLSDEVFKLKCKSGYTSLSTAQQTEIEDVILNLTKPQSKNAPINTNYFNLLRELCAELPPAQQSNLLGKLFLIIFKHGSEQDIAAFLSEDNHLFRYYEFVKDARFRNDLVTYILDVPAERKKLNILDLPHTGYIQYLNQEQQNAYYNQKVQEISKYIDVHQAVNQRRDVWSEADKIFMNEMRIKKNQEQALTKEEQNQFGRLLKLKTNPYLEYIENGVTLSLSRGLTVSLKSNNASKQMVIDTLDYCFKQLKGIAQRKSQGFFADFFSDNGSARETIYKDFIQKLLNCGPISALLPFSFEETQNKLLDTLAQRPDLYNYLIALLDNSDFYEKGMSQNFCIKESNSQQGRPVQHNYNSHQSLTAEQKDLMNRLQIQYPLPQTFNAFEKRQELKEILVQRYRANPLIVDRQEMPLDSPSRLSKRQIQACYKHPLHTVIRYLSVPNKWMHYGASFSDNQKRCAVIEEEQVKALWVFWMAASDTTEAMRPTEEVMVDDRKVRVTVDDRIQTYIEAIAQPARAHNYKSKASLGLVGYGAIDAHVEVDDLQPDYPSCADGATQRIYSSLLDHPLLKSNFVYAKTMIDQLKKDHMFAHIYSQMKLNNYQMILEAAIDSGNADLLSLRQFNLPYDEVPRFKHKIVLKMPSHLGLPWIYDRLTEHCYYSNQTCHVLTCAKELNELKNNSAELIKCIVNQEVMATLKDAKYEQLRQAWEAILANNADDHLIAPDERDLMQQYNFAHGLENFVDGLEKDNEVQEIDVDSLKAQFQEKYPQLELPDKFFEELKKYVEKNSFLTASQILEMGNITGYQPYDGNECSRLKETIQLKLMLHKINGILENEASTVLAPIMIEIERKLEQLNSPTESCISAASAGW